MKIVAFVIGAFAVLVTFIIDDMEFDQAWKPTVADRAK
jgi:hypothetical protein